MGPVLLILLQAWVVKDVLPPTPPSPGTELQIAQFVAIGDLNGDDCVENYSHAGDHPYTQDLLGIFRGWAQRERSVHSILPFRISSGAAQGPRVALLQSPTGILTAYLDSQNGGLLHTRRYPDLHDLVAVSPSLRPGAFIRFPDVNGDGWEELFCQDYSSNEGYSMMVDGRTLTTIWRKVLPDSEYPSMLTRNTAHEPQDLDGDLIPDPIAVWTTYNLQTGSWEDSTQAFSGASGTQLWENRESPSGGLLIPSVSEHDLTHDGKWDVILASAAGIRLVSGSDGATVWSVDITPILQSAGPAGWTYEYPLYPAILTPMPGSNALHLVLPVRYWQVQVHSVFRIELAHFDPYSGAFLGFGALPADLAPWFPDPFWNPRGDSVVCALGDVDRDGLQELSFPVNAPAYDLASTSFIPKHFVTLGLRTLEIPTQLRIGIAGAAEVSIPSAPHHDFFLVGSRIFDRRGGVRLEGWRTNLADDPWLTWSTASRAFAGTLDAAGNGQTLVAVPVNPALIGTTLYTRAVVLAPGGQEIWTLSTLGISEIVP